MTLNELFTTLYRPLRLRGRSPGTSRLYAATIRAYEKFLGRAPTLEDLDELRLARYLEHRATQVAAHTAEKERTQLIALAGLAWERRLIDTKPTVPPAPLPDRVPVAWTMDEMRALMVAASDPATFKRRGEWKPSFFSALIPALWETGERIGAILESRVEDYQRPHLLARAEARKGRKRDRLYRLTGQTCDRIDAILAGRSTFFVFDWPLCRGYLWHDFAKIVRAAGLDGRKRVRFHQIRRSAASHYAAAGGDAVEMLDHSSPKITKRWYLDPRLSDRGSRPCDVLPPIADMTPRGTV